MVKKNKGKLILSSVVILLPLLFGLILWDRLPDRLATHWNIKGEVDGWSSKAVAVFLMPLIMLALQWACVFLSAKDSSNKGQNKTVLGLVFWICPALSLFVNGVTYATALGLAVNIATCFTILFALLFLVIGNYMPKCKQNHTIGIRIPWTLKDEENWNATHRFAGKLWFAGGFFLLLAAIAQMLTPFTLAFPLVFAVILIVVIVPMAYSYLHHRRQQNR